MQADIYFTNNVYNSEEMHNDIFLVYMFVGYCLLLVRMYCRSLSISNLFIGLDQVGMQGAVQVGMQGRGQGGMQGMGQGGDESACVVVNVCIPSLSHLDTSRFTTEQWGK